ncbi:MAG: 50S ribosomal protein L4 [Bdellovibrionota bacterium]
MATKADKKSVKEGELALVDSSGKEIGTKAVSSEVFAKSPKHIMHQVVRWQRAKRRAGTHSTQTRAEMSGGGKKPWKQKGTGNARAGSNTSPLWVGGGIAHGPKPRDYEFRLNKQERKRALSGALSARKEEGRLFLVSDFGLKGVKTKDAQKVLSSLGIEKGESALVVLSDINGTEAKSLRNIDRVNVLIPAGLNTYDVLRNKFLVITEEALSQVEQRLSGGQA